ncbi:hypothetical protein GCM10007940_21120 [Portibacter lacus]|uniref:Uncharacterized protein n=2 Tax=Portibacter lacus TaxID=1099794 RepID=A0AA37SQ43_9BACT|nr:hypothetical protein GCM10007940_21120 [Portibacter lacus]
MALFVLLISSCEKDDPILAEEVSPSLFKSTLVWQPELLEYFEITHDSLPKSIDIEWDTPTEMEFDEEAFYEGFGYGVMRIAEGDTTYSIGASQITGSDTSFVGFTIFGNIEERTYNYVSLDIFDFLLSGKIAEPADGSVLPVIMDPHSTISSDLASAAQIGKVDCSGSTFKINEFNKETGEISGRFTLSMVLVDDKGKPTIPMLKVKDGYFNKLKIYEVSE